MILKVLLSVILFLTSITLLSFNITKPFYGEHDWNGARYGNIARNYLKYGVLELKLAQIENSGLAEKKDFEYFTHYPPTLTLLIAGSFTIFGISEWSARLVPIVISGGIIVLIFLIGDFLRGKRFGLLASLIAMLTPIFLYFGKTPVHEPLVVFCVLLAFLGFLKKIKWLFILGLILAHLSTWAGYFLIPAMTLVALLKRDSKEVKLLLPLWCIPIIMFSLHIAYIIFTTGSIIGGDLLGAFFQRTSLNQNIQPDNLNLLNFFSRLRIWISTLYTLTLSLISLSWLLSLRFTKIQRSDWAVITFGIFGSIYLIVFPNATFIHNYLIFYLLPFFAFSGASFITLILNLKINRKIGLIMTGVILIAIPLERKDFLIALNASQGDKLAVEIGKTINQQTNEQDTILVSPLGYSYSADNFLKFYSDRKLTYNEGIKFDYQVVVDEKNNQFKIIKK